MYRHFFQKLSSGPTLFYFIECINQPLLSLVHTVLISNISKYVAAELVPVIDVQIRILKCDSLNDGAV